MQPEEYSYSRRLTLAGNVLLKHRIYLDSKFWISLTKARKGVPEEAAHSDIYRLLVSLVSSGQVICPISCPIFCEVLGAAQFDTRIDHAKTMDELSMGVTIQPPHILDFEELRYFLNHSSFPDENFVSPEKIVWNHAAHVLGEALPEIPQISAELNRDIQIRFLKDIDTCSITDIVQQLGEGGLGSLNFDTKGHAAEQTDNQKKFEHEFNSFQDVFMSEVAGILDTQEWAIRKFWTSEWVEIDGEVPDSVPLENSIRYTRNLIYNAYKLGKLSTQFPGIHILAGIYAIKRHTSKIQGGPYAKKGDLKDHLHARTALPYFNAFFTEKKLAHYIINKPLYYDKQYNCTTLSRNKEIFEYLAAFDKSVT